jgi:hypothetical protein
LTGSNFGTWKENLEITLALLNIYYALLNDPPIAPTKGDENYDALKRDYDDEKTKWEDSNRKCLMIIKGFITQSMRGAVPDSQTAKGYLGKIEDQFKGSSKIYATSLIRRLIDEMYDPTGSLREHIMMKINMATKLKTMEWKSLKVSLSILLCHPCPRSSLRSPSIIMRWILNGAWMK